MPIYYYRAMTKDGLIVRNKVEEISKQTLIKKLKNNNITPISVDQVAYQRKQGRQQKKNVTDIQELMKNITTTNINRSKSKSLSTKEKIMLSIAKSEPITSRDLVVFTQNFYLLKKANFNNIHALNTIIKSTENVTLKGILEDILAGVESGENMYTTMEYYSNVFPYIYINMIKVGELSGSLENSLKQAVKYLDDSERINKKLKSILIPNLVQFALLIVMLFVGTLFAIPAIQNVFEELGTKDTLPAITLWFQKVVNMLIAYWYIPLGLIVIAVSAIIFYINTPKGKYNFHYFKYTMPIFGKLIYSLDFSRFMKAMLLNLKNGMRVQEALEVSKNVVQNYVMLSIIETSINNVLVGDSWIEPFEKSNFHRPWKQKC